MIQIRTATPADIPAIQYIAEVTWIPTYEPIVAPGQVRYMLDLFYNAEILKQQLVSGEQTFLVLTENDTPVGFAAYGPRKENPDVYKLHKLYCLPLTQGKGFGRMLIDKVEESVKHAGKHTLELNVNRDNTAKYFYERMGYSVAYDEDIDIGNGYFMIDHVMRKAL
ncbi:MAG: GNAT family N-acetyltransferase [Sphingobacteriales bacterium]|nr:MAG: GNAT family N-acetyltransferase [Sphingobacteriales bacterium]